MPIDKSDPAFHLTLDPNPFYLFQYDADVPVPASLFTSPKYTAMSVSRTPGELTIVLALASSLDGEKQISGVEAMGEAKESHGPWTCFQVAGPIPLGKSGPNGST